MKKFLVYLNFGILPLLMLIFMYGFIIYVPTNLKPLFVVFVLLLLLLTYLEEHLRSFVYLIAGTLAIGFFFVITVWGKANVNQVNIIIIQTVLILISVIVWIQSIYFKRIIEENEALKRRVRELEKFVGDLKIYTKEEFLDFARTLISSALRRKEKLGVIVFKLKPHEGKIADSFTEILGKSISKTIRSNFDAAGLVSQDTIAILLQNTDKNGALKAFERIKNAVLDVSRVNLEEFLNQFEISIDEFDGTFEDFQKFLGV
ncbi:MAG: hypothetical protein JHC30_05820 [Caldisericum sp.]|nr:hypothetical protein [Caldisericum sp.]